MKILSVTSEIFPLIKTGGLADVTGSLPKALSSYGVQTKTLIPGYPTVLRKLKVMEPLLTFEDLLGVKATVLQGHYEGLDILVLNAPELYDRAGGPYVNEWGWDHPDNWKRFAALSLAAAEIGNGALPGWIPDVVHSHDWQSALTSVYLRYRHMNAVPSVLTIHNLAFQGQFPASTMSELGLPREAFSIDCLEYHGDISLLKGGLMTADAITTVSPTYAREVLSPALGMGLNGVLNARLGDLRGIVNGIDFDIWNPATDPLLPQNYNHLTLKRRRVNRERLASTFGIDEDSGLIFASVSRLTWQKGSDILADIIDDIVSHGGKLVVLGNGDHHIQQSLLAAAERHPGRVAVKIGYDEPTAHLIHAGADAMVQPSRFEPCGLTQLYALRYGCVPVVSRTGGLSETIIDANDAAMVARVATGFQFHPVTRDGLLHAVWRAFETYENPKKWARLQTQGMKAKFSWEHSAEQYLSLYQSVLLHRRVDHAAPTDRPVSAAI